MGPGWSDVPCPLAQGGGGGPTGRARLKCAEDGVALWPREKTWFGRQVSGSVSMKAGKAGVKCSLPFQPCFSCTLLSSGLFTLNSEVWLALGQHEPFPVRRGQLSRSLLFERYKFLKFTLKFTCYVLSFHHLEGISVRYCFRKITPHSVARLVFFFKLLLLLA